MRLHNTKVVMHSHWRIVNANVAGRSSPSSLFREGFLWLMAMASLSQHLKVCVFIRHRRSKNPFTMQNSLTKVR